MGAAAIAFAQDPFDARYQEMLDYLSSEEGYWKNEDVWTTDAEAFAQAGIRTQLKGKRTLADFSGYRNVVIYLIFDTHP